MGAPSKILVIVTNADRFESVGFRTGLWLSELTHFWDVAEQAGCQLEIASPSGGKVPLDPESLIFTELGHSVGLEGKVAKRYKDPNFMARLDRTVGLGDIDGAGYDAVYLTGGHGVMFDFPNCQPLAALVADFYETGRIISAVCHGPCGLLDVRVSSGAGLLEGKHVTGFSWREEAAAKREHAVPFSLEAQLRQRGATYTSAKVPFAAHVVEDGRLITGQNPASAHAVAQAVVAQLEQRPTAHSA